MSGSNVDVLGCFSSVIASLQVYGTRQVVSQGEVNQQSFHRVEGRHCRVTVQGNGRAKPMLQLPTYIPTVGTGESIGPGPAEQAGATTNEILALTAIRFTRGRSTKDAIFVLRLLSEHHREFSRPINFTHIGISRLPLSG